MSNENYVGNRCVYCGEDTSFGSGRFVNRIPADSDCKSYNQEGKVIYEDGEYRDGYACAECMAMPCDRCSELIPLDEDITPYDVYFEDDERSWSEFSDGSFRVHHKCLTEDERLELKFKQLEEVNYVQR